MAGVLIHTLKYDYVSSATLVVMPALLVAFDDMQGACTNGYAR